MATYQRPARFDDATPMTIQEYARRAGQLRRSRNWQQKPAVTQRVTCQTSDEARLPRDAPTMSCVTPSGRLVKKRTKGSDRWTVVSALRGNERAEDLTDVAIRPSPARALAPPAAGVPRRFLGFEEEVAGSELPEAEPPEQLTRLLNNAELHYHFPTVAARSKHRYAVADVSKILGVVQTDKGPEVIVAWTDEVVRDQVRVPAAEVRGIAPLLEAFLAAQSRQRVDPTFWNCEATGNERVDPASGAREIEVVWDADGTTSWARKSDFL